jgi:hypothetical protein
MKRFFLVALSTFLVTFSFTPSVHAQKFKNCTELRKVYPKGVAKNAKAAQTTGATLNAKVYNANKSSDRDNDGAACES